MTAGASVHTDGIGGGGHGPTRHEPLIDRFGPRLTYLRVSVTERCHLRCGYCASAGENGTDAGALRPAPFDRLFAVFRGLAVRHVRFTGGEPLLCAHLNSRKAWARTLSFARVSLTTNGPLLARRAAGLDAARRVLARVQLNVVLLRDQNRCEWPALVAFAITHGYDMRFIEAMPLGEAGAATGARNHIDTAAVHSELAQRYRLREVTPVSDHGPARRFAVAGSAIEIGFISPLSQEFCASCNRLRLTSHARLIYCLGHTDGLDLRAALAQGLDDESLAALMRRQVAHDKPKGYEFGSGTTRYRYG